CDVMVLSDYEQGYAQVADIDNKPPSGTLDGGTESVWDIRLHNAVVASSVEVNDYNYRTAGMATHFQTKKLRGKCFLNSTGGK
ncbi:hypothetical protein, partial [Gilliamella sp. Choc5-1]|uniref:hypothetical protein n=1 Tax=Gilliamella sp. Choc5-1 TaxID=3120238 RepID=UPI00159EE03B